MEGLLSALKAAGEPTRLRILAILEHHELTVSELVTILGQSQPRVSRHLKVLVEANVLERHSEGTSAFYRLARSAMGGQLAAHVLTLVDHSHPELARDTERLERVREQRASLAATYFEEVAEKWDDLRNQHVPDAQVEAALLQALGQHEVHNLLDLGTGTGRILEVCAPHVRSALGIDLSRQMLTVARDKLLRSDLSHCSVRQGDLTNLDVATGSMDAAVLHHVLHFLDDPDRAIAEAARTLRPNGMLVVVDFAPHTLESLRSDHAHRRLGFAESDIAAMCVDAGLVDMSAQHFSSTATDTSELLTVTLWTARQHQDTHSRYELEVA